MLALGFLSCPHLQPQSPGEGRRRGSSVLLSTSALAVPLAWGCAVLEPVPVGEAGGGYAVPLADSPSVGIPSSESAASELFALECRYIFLFLNLFL